MLGNDRATSATTAAAALILSSIKRQIFRSTADVARSAWMSAIQRGPSSFAMSQSCAIRSSGTG